MSAPRYLVAALALIAGAAPAQESQRRLTPAEAASLPIVGAGAGTSGVAGIETRLLAGDPTKAGPYTIAIRVPPNMRIAAHTHRDDRSAVVVSGLWHFGYGGVADDTASRALPPGSYYTEPAADPHFAWTGPEGATVFITGVGPSDTHYTTKDRP
ncbi:putative RmlC-like cupin family protein [Sphingomonas sp. UYAg733]